MIKKIFMTEGELEDFLEDYTGDGDIDTWEGPSEDHNGAWIYGVQVYETEAEFNAMLAEVHAKNTTE